MTDERLDQILKQALAPEMNDSEIQVQRKVRDKKMNMKKIVATGLVACAALTLVITGGYLSGGPKGGSIGAAGTSKESALAGNHLFAITAYATELPDDIASGDVTGLRLMEADSGNSSFLTGRFSISGQNIDRVKITTDQCSLYTSVPVYEGDPGYETASNFTATSLEAYDPVYEGDPETDGHIAYYDHTLVAGQSYEGAYNDKISFGMSVPEELWSTTDDPKQGYWDDVDQVDGAKLTVTVTYSDGSTETHHYKLTTGKIFVPAGENDVLQWDRLTRFLTADEEAKGETPFCYGYLIEKVD